MKIEDFITNVEDYPMVVFAILTMLLVLYIKKLWNKSALSKIILIMILLTVIFSVGYAIGTYQPPSKPIWESQDMILQRNETSAK